MIEQYVELHAASAFGFLEEPEQPLEIGNGVAFRPVYK